MQLSELFAELYSRISQMTTSEFTDLLLQTQNPDEKEFYSTVFNMILQQKQKQVIQANKF